MKTQIKNAETKRGQILKAIEKILKTGLLNNEILIETLEDLKDEFNTYCDYLKEDTYFYKDEITERAIKDIIEISKTEYNEEDKDIMEGRLIRVINS
jgi:hypothetical protein